MTEIADYRYEIYNNPNQGPQHRALFVCSGGILRSATAAHWAAEHKHWNTRSCGIYSIAIPPINGNLVKWAASIFCMEPKHQEFIESVYGEHPQLYTLHIPDNFSYRDPELIRHIAAALKDYP